MRGVIIEGVYCAVHAQWYKRCAIMENVLKDSPFHLIGHDKSDCKVVMIGGI